jgi:hypothetical protein
LLAFFATYLTKRIAGCTDGRWLSVAAKIGTCVDIGVFDDIRLFSWNGAGAAGVIATVWLACSGRAVAEESASAVRRRGTRFVLDTSPRVAKVWALAVNECAGWCRCVTATACGGQGQHEEGTEEEDKEILFREHRQSPGGRLLILGK